MHLMKERKKKEKCEFVWHVLPAPPLFQILEETQPSNSYPGSLGTYKQEDRDIGDLGKGEVFSFQFLLFTQFLLDGKGLL